MYETDGTSFVVICSCGQRMAANQESLGKSGICTACGTTIRIVPSTDGALEPREENQCCYRCGKAFQGEWDRTHTDSGYFCHVCANSVNSDATIIESRPIVPDCKAYEFIPPLPPEEERTKARKPSRRELQCFAAVFVIAMLLNFYLPIGEWLNDMSGTLAKTGTVEVGPVLRVVLESMRILKFIVRFFLTLFITLKWANQMPNEDTWKNVTVILFFSVILAILSSIFWMPAALFGIWLIFYHFDFGIKEYIFFLVTGSVIGFLVTIVYKFIMSLLLYSFGAV